MTCGRKRSQARGPGASSPPGPLELIVARTADFAPLALGTLRPDLAIRLAAVGARFVVFAVATPAAILLRLFLRGGVSLLALRLFQAQCRLVHQLLAQ